MVHGPKISPNLMVLKSVSDYLSGPPTILKHRVKYHNNMSTQIELWTKPYPPGVHLLARIQDETVARSHLDKLGISLDTLTQEQADYINVDIGGPYKPDYYRY